ncbi:MAG: DUF885 domain-containing protein [Deltaproteobacteria bacterium]|nr:DUF885 domain-containing protein [Deltaproteobacteria bacterium]
MRIFVLVAACAGAWSCGGARPQEQFSKLAETFVYETLALSPVASTGAGYHEHHGAKLDELLDDFSRSSLQKQHSFYVGFRARLEQSVDDDKLPPEDRADYDIIMDQISLALLELDSIQSYRHNPTVYVELLGNALFNPYVLEYAPKAKRYEQIIARLEKIPAFLSQAKLNLSDSPEVWNRVAREENDGNVGLIDRTLRAGCPPELKARFDTAADTALAGLRAFNEYLKSDLSRHTSDWRLGKENYERKFRFALGTDKSPRQLLNEAEFKLKSVRAQMERTAGKEGVKAALDRIAQKHATPEIYFADAKRDLAEVTEFVKQKHLLDLPPSGNLDVIPTPEFMRGIYSVGGFNPAPALEPKLGAFYWITTISPNWPKERVESKLREYNTYGLKVLTIHEAMPGHWVQAEFAAQVQPPVRRLLRNVFGNGPYVEGWAVYATEIVVGAGYLNNSPDMQLTWSKQLLRAVANTILDIRLHTLGMTEEQAMNLMINDTYQEREEAVEKWQRAQLSSCQLPMYFLGYRGWLDAWKADYERNFKSEQQLAEFHERALQEGAVRLPSLAGLIASKK